MSARGQLLTWAAIFFSEIADLRLGMLSLERYFHDEFESGIIIIISATIVAISTERVKASPIYYMQFLCLPCHF